MAEPAISDLEQLIRNHINRGRVKHLLLQEPLQWNQLCSSLDTIGDTELCFEAYEKATPSGDGALYLLMYGVVQALVLQQDAVRHMSEALGIAFEPEPLLQEIRELRNSSVGHPTKRRGKPRVHFISRISMSKTGFQLMTVYPDHSPADFTPVDIPGMIRTQRARLCSVMQQVVDALEKRDKEHREMFSKTKLVETFPPTMGYYFEKLYEAVGGRHSAEYGAAHVKLLQEAVERFKLALKERGSAGAYDSVEYHLELVDYPLGELAAYFLSPQSARLSDRDANIFTHFVQDQMRQLREMAVEIDQDYEGS